MTEVISPSHPTPVPVGERIVAPDIVRGFALFGILLVNMEDFSTLTSALAVTPWPAWAERGA